MSGLTAEFNEKFNEIKHNYVKSLNEKFVLFTNLTDLIDDSENSNRVFVEIYENAHKLSGSSGIFGFVELSRLSNELELDLKEFIDGGYLSLNKAVFSNLKSLLIEIKNILQEGI